MVECINSFMKQEIDYIFTILNGIVFAKSEVDLFTQQNHIRMCL